MVEVISMIDPKELIAVEAKGLDLSEFEGVRALIEKIEIVEVQSTFSTTGKQECLKVMTNPITSIETIDGEKKEIRASELFNLVRDPKTNKLGYSKHKKGALNKFLIKMKVKDPSDLIGKYVTIKTRVQNEKTFLGFIRE